MTDRHSERISTLRERLIIHRRRLAKLREQKARLGFSAPAHLELEIEDTEVYIQRIEDELSELGSSVEDSINDLDIEVQTRNKSDCIFVLGSGVIENVLKLDSDIIINHKHKVIREDRFGGSGINYTFRLANTKHNVLPVLSIGKDNAGHKIQQETLNVMKRNHIKPEFIKFCSDERFLCEDMSTSESVIVVSYPHRTIFTGQLENGIKFVDFAKERMFEIQNMRSVLVRAVMIGHIHPDDPDINEHCPGDITKTAIMKFQGDSLIFTNFGDSQIKMGHNEWEHYLQYINIFQLSLGEARSLFRYGGENFSLRQIITWFQENKTTAVITLDKFGAIATYRDEPNILVAWPIKIKDLKDTTGAGDAFGAGLIAHLYQTQEFSLEDFRKAMRIARIWAAYSCAQYGGAADCPTNAQLNDYRIRTEREQKEARKVELLDPDKRSEVLDLIDRAY